MFTGYNKAVFYAGEIPDTASWKRVTMVNPFASREDGMNAHDIAGKVRDVARTDIAVQNRLIHLQRTVSCHASSQTMAIFHRSLHRRLQVLR